ncbi:MAG: hypothetical protein WD226_05360 [Planctomycetota bacterium]
MLAQRLFAPIPLLLLSLAATELTYAPAPGTTLTRTFWSRVTGEFDVRVELAGQPQEAEIPPMSLDSDERIRVVDRIESVVGGRPARLSRTFEEVAVEEKFRMDGDATLVEETSPFVGETVTFVWDSEGAAYRVELPEDSGLDEAQVDDLVEDMDLRGLLPGRTVETGDRWEADLSVMGALMFPGGQLHARDVTSDEAVPAWKTELDRQVLANLTGTLTVELLGVEDGVARLGLEVDVTTEGTAEMEVHAESPVTHSSVEVEIAREGSGVARWSLDEGHLVGLDLEVDATMSMRERNEFPLPDGPVEVVQLRDFEGEIAYELLVE